MATKENKRYLGTYTDGSIYSGNETNFLGVHKNYNTNVIWSSEINELEILYESFKGQIPELDKELERLINTNDPIVIMLYARRSLEVIVTELCEKELKRPRKTQPLKGIIDLLNCREKVPQHIIASMLSLNSLSAYGAHPKDFDAEQVKPVLNNLSTIIKWNLKHNDVRISEKVNNSTIACRKITCKSGFGKRSLIACLSVVLFLTLSAFYYYTNRFSSTGEQKIMDKSVAVLPFKDISEKNDQYFFCDGMMSEIRNQLYKIDDLRVITGNSTLIYKDSRKSEKEIARELEVAFLIHGEVRRAGNIFRITIWLVDGKTQKNFLHTYNDTIVDPSQVFDIQSKIASEIAIALQEHINPDLVKGDNFQLNVAAY